MFARPFLGALVGLSATVVLAAAPPSPLVIPASQYFEGNDGPWSTFDVRVGTPEQYIRVLVSTASPYTLVPLAGEACSSSVFSTVPSGCALSRGNLFDPKQSSSWKDIGLYGINENGVGFQANLGYSQRVQFASEHLGIGLTGPGLDNQIVGAIATPQPFYMGIFGLNTQPLNFSILGNETTQSFLTVLKDENKIPSLSWSYTAGAKYRLKEVYGQLILGGYDRSRFRENSVSFSMAEDLTRDLVVGLHSISVSGSTTATILSDPIDIFIDSTDPNLWLPAEACDAFEEAFGLTLDSQSGLYLVNDSHRNTLLDTNAQVSFRLSDVKSGGETVTIVLPYAAFDLVAKNPLVGAESHYFPLKRANSSKQYTLGRVFLQEAYLSADYESKVFNVSACTWNQGAKEDIVPILSDGSGSRGGGGGGSGGSSLSKGTIAGIVVGAVLGALLIIALIAVFILRKRRKWLKRGFTANTKDPAPDWSVLRGPVFNSPSQRESTSAADGSMPYSAADVSTRASGPSPESAAAGADGVAVENGVGRTPMVELDGRDSYIGSNVATGGGRANNLVPPVAESPGGVYELPGSGPGTGKLWSSGRFGHHNSRKSAGSARGSSPSSLASTAERTGGAGRDSLAVSDVGSPDSPTWKRKGGW